MLSTTGETSRQGPHQGAQKSTRTGLSALRTSDSKVASSTEIGAVVAMTERTCLPSVETPMAIIVAPAVPGDRSRGLRRRRGRRRRRQGRDRGGRRGRHRRRGRRGGRRRRGG